MEFNFLYQRNQKRVRLTQCKLLLFTLIFFYGAQIHANEALKCLGREELRLHKTKNTGPQYQLNQVFLNELSSNNDIKIKPKYIKIICKDSKLPPSVTLLKILMLKQRSIFNIEVRSDRIDGLKNFKIAQIDDLVGRAAPIFFQYLAGLQVSSPSAKCLEQKLPALKRLFNRFTYLQSEVKATDLLENKRDIQSIFTGLENINNLYKICAREIQKKKNQAKK